MVEPTAGIRERVPGDWNLACRGNPALDVAFWFQAAQARVGLAWLCRLLGLEQPDGGAR